MIYEIKYCRGYYQFYRILNLRMEKKVKSLFLGCNIFRRSLLAAEYDREVSVGPVSCELGENIF